jgi:6-phosphogluconolactonase (cycloisomerase 2 family)
MRKLGRWTFMAAVLMLGACMEEQAPPQVPARGASLNADLGNDFSGNYLWVHGVRSQAADAKYPCLNEVTACLALDASGQSEALFDLCPSIDTPEGTWRFEYALYTDECRTPLANVRCVVEEGEQLAPGENHDLVECLTDNAVKDFRVCLYDPATGAGFGACNPVSCVYANNNPAGPNSVTAFKANADGSLTEVAGSPFPTGGDGSGDGFYAANRILAQLGTYLYASNSASGTIAAFAIDPSTCALGAVEGSPFPAEPYPEGLSLASAPDGAYLYAGGGTQLLAYAVAPSGALSPLATYPLDSPADGMKVSPDGRFVAVANFYANRISMFGIGADGSLAPVPGSPFAADPAGAAAGVEINCSSDLLFLAEANGSTTLVDVFAIASDGSLSPPLGTLYSLPPGVNSNVAVLSPDEAYLFVSNQFSDTITVAAAGAGGSLTAVPGSPFAAPGVPCGMATDAAGTFLYAAAAAGRVLGFGVGGDGTLAPVPGSPFPVPYPIESLAVFPPKTCP